MTDVHLTFSDFLLSRMSRSMCSLTSIHVTVEASRTRVIKIRLYFFGSFHPLVNFTLVNAVIAMLNIPR